MRNMRVMLPGVCRLVCHKRVVCKCVAAAGQWKIMSETVQYAAAHHSGSILFAIFHPTRRQMPPNARTQHTMPM
ncbi:hypothetical protein CYLTODRAFT_116478 [Cylindrobasidium torrendii FP15055 ss-10]|uniref:Uncharacterized protein n=1 Tax=Cylindrobasidium torrendii FP15055 ss-10 TaxID=1314674 RepID=A0A0D7BMU9_9AGAR|nr:hypothetical protein CYLTODRAFT_116478 [Cylindrobasidium torrendii FP15055 ss-10]